MSTRADLSPDHPFRVARRPAGSSIAAALTLVLAFALATYVVVAGWPA